MIFNAFELGYRELNEKIRAAKGEAIVDQCFGERFIGCAASGKKIIVNGTPGNALGAYLNGAELIVNGNAQDAAGDTMNDGKIVINGDAGDALGYAMRGGRIFVRGNAGYRTGIHMKQYQEKRPVIVVGGHTGSFLGEYLAGGLIIVLGLESEECPTGNFTGTGMHGGEIFIRSGKAPANLPRQVTCAAAGEPELEGIRPVLEEFSKQYQIPMDEILGKPFYRLTPNAKNPYHQLYTEN